MLAALAVMFATTGFAVLALFLRGTPPEALAVVRLLLDSITTVAGHTAVLVMLSSIASGVGDVALYVATLFVGQMLAGLAALNRWPGLTRATEEIQRFLMSILSWTWPRQSATGRPPRLRQTSTRRGS